MSHTSMQRLALLLTASLAVLFVALALTSERASATPFCGGQTISNVQTCFGAPRTFRYVVGRADSTGVCVGYNEVPYGGCSSSAHALAAMDIGSYAWRTPRIIGNAPSKTTVEYADAY